MPDEQLKATIKRMQAEIRENQQQQAARGIIPAPADMKPMGSFADDNPAAHEANRNEDDDEYLFQGMPVSDSQARQGVAGTGMTNDV